MTKLTPQWKFAELLHREGLTLHHIQRYLSNEDVPQEAVERWAQGTPKTLDLEFAGLVLAALKEATGKPYALSDLVEYEAATAAEDDVPAWQSLAGIWDYPDAPEDGSANLDAYLDDALREELQDR